VIFTDIAVLRWRQVRNNHLRPSGNPDLRLNCIKSSVKSNPD